MQTGVPTTTGTTAATPGDRFSVLADYVTLTESTATTFARCEVPSGTVAGGSFTITIEGNDATDFQALTYIVEWSAVNKAGTITTAIQVSSGATAVSSGTLTATITAVDAGAGTNTVAFKADAVSSLTQTVLRAQLISMKNFGTGSFNN